jgi:glycosyltransferase involved in cell wall biosynthesis
LNSISIIIPAQNEASRLENTLDSYVSYFSHLEDEKFEIIVVCNGCQDSTLQIAVEFTQKNNKVKVINVPEKIGKGQAIKEGFRVAHGDICLFTDADGSTSASESSKLILAVREGNDVAIGSRRLRGCKILIKQRLSRRIAGWGFNRLVRLLFGLPFKDTQCGAKAFSKEATGLVLSSVKTNGFTFDVDLLWRLNKNGYRIQEVPITWGDSSGSTLILRKAIPRMLVEVLKLRFSSG